jgi:hypothetical protein
MNGRRALHVAVIVLLATTAYAGSFSGGFVSDDVTAIAGNPLLRSLAPSNLRAIATSFDDANYIPLKVLSLALDYQVWGLTPAGYHVTNLALHVANALLVYLVLLRLGEPAGAACAVALLWAVHPVQVESVAWISERKNVLSTLFFLLGFLVYLRFSEQPRARTYLLLLALFVCALLSKVNTVVLPALMLAYEVGERFRLRGRDLAATVPLLAVGALLAWVNLHGNPSHGVAYHGGSLAVTVRTMSTVLPRYLALALAPWQPSFYHAVPLRGSWLEPAVLGGALTLLASIAVAVALIARRRRGAFWIAWFFVTLAPMLNLVPFPALMADRYLYIPLLAPLVLVAWGMRALAVRFPLLGRGMPALAGAAALACAGFTLARVPVFRNELSLWADWAVRTPYITADRPYGPKPRPAELRILRDALAREGDSAVLHNNLGGIAFEEGRLRDALAELTRARQLDPQDPAIALNLGRAYLHAGDPAAAARTLEDAVRLESPSYFAWLNLGRACLQLRDAPRARQALEQARRMRPDWQDWRREWTVLEQLERTPS